MIDLENTEQCSKLNSATIKQNALLFNELELLKDLNAYSAHTNLLFSLKDSEMPD